MKYQIIKFNKNKISWDNVDYIFQVYIYDKDNYISDIINVTDNPITAIYFIRHNRDENSLPYLLDENLFTILKKVNDYEYVLKPTEKLLLEVI